jgi:inner membrane protein
MCVGRIFATEAEEPKRTTSSLAVFAGLALLPDADYLGVALGGPDHGPLGHRGAAHSFALPLLVAVFAFALATRLRLPAWRLAIAVGLAVGSHALLDAMTGGHGRGVPLLWPLTFHRFEAPWRPIPDAPCGLAYLSGAGLKVAVVELIEFAPFLLFALRPRALAGRTLMPPMTRLDAAPAAPSPSVAAKQGAGI